MPDRKKVVLPIVAAVGLALLLWLVFHNRSSDAEAGPAPAPLSVAVGKGAAPTGA